ncbi:hypothetical protein ACFSRY_20055 [Pontibacter locisalis]|uniref:Uncharacterized protein n=1 Tax=Pontibacter locisalis TaxID=1719035 RepID=A0ABW5IU03_9BACT
MKPKPLILILLLTLLFTATQAQDFPLLVPKLEYSHSVALSSPTTISKDRSGNIYFLGLNSNLLRLDPLGRPLGNYSPPVRGRISIIDAWNPMKVMVFYRDRQEVLLLDRFLRPIISTDLTDINYQGTAKVASLASDDSFWLFDETNLVLSKLDLQLRKTVVETPLNLILDRERFDVKQLREYQNMVYMLDANGVFVFDNLGNYKKKLLLPGLSYIGFHNNDMYFIQEGELHFLDLYSSERRSYALPKTKAFVSALVGEGFLYLITPKTVEVYNWLQ